MLQFGNTLVFKERADAVNFVLRPRVVSTLDNLIRGVLLGVLVGITQWLVLRWQFRRTGWWVLATTAGFFLGAISSWWIIKRYLGSISVFHLYPVLIAISRGFTEITLVWLLRQRTSQP